MYQEWATRMLRIIICGEAPGESEEREGIPFVGPSGNMLNEIFRYVLE